MLTCDNISAQKNGRTLFSRFGITLFPGACLLIKGRNGIGKSTLLRIIANLTHKSEGNIFFNTLNVKLALHEFYSLLFYINTQDILDKNQTVLQNLKFWAKLYNQEINILAAVKTFALEPYVHTAVSNLSQGFKQRVLLARLLLNNTKIWLLDEPLNGLDNYGKDIFVNLVKARCMQSGIVIIVTHDEIPITNACKVNLEDFYNV
ncbi:heme ABC exporter ATP-binding protein CcmA [Candidatus Bandiella euplotis]|uniref:Cytochrome c biogenesis ATP-binding export protein CcmA n=1 Tax=Candidatus Bandiella euplotis TaxID=1664265 RepID=A0ABZ0UQJ3_9RICK|nr:heme ABC exporter ATP-binding protein CcmA [Candidatus Bandiella woodruffii]WPX97185.1 Cytochrome c biogenesis ATP-binding export protein CcmA [Candidatus Bandiella woodruffii]